ncbi:hypothetical protein BH11GEM2_BH11GEM2_40530 [soil metagenome]
MSQIANLTVPEPRLEQFRKLSDINRAFTYTITLEQVARLTVDGATDLLGSKSAVLMIHDAEGLLQVQAAHGVADEPLARFRASVTDEVVGRLQGLLDVPAECFTAVPLVVGGSVTGIVAVGLDRPATEPDEWLLSALADQAAVTLENARLGGEVRLDMEGRLRASEGAAGAKDRALATLAHDIRSPIGAIEGYCTILEEEILGPVNDKQRDALARVRMSGRHLLSLLENVMDMARLSAGVSSAREERVDLRAVARDAVDILTPASYAKRQLMHLDPGTEIAVRGDAARIRQVLVNLVGNAVKFTPELGHVTVSVAHVSDGDGEWGEARVTDTGPGIAPAEQAAIFEAYYRAEGTVSEPGIGLGLAISAALAVQMGGTLTVESRDGAGSSFTIRLPLDGQDDGARMTSDSVATVGS